MAEKYLLVVSLLEGRHFPRRPQRRLVVEARFDGECLATDPVFHDQIPDINTELAWEVEKKSLRQHRLQRTPIKLQLFAVDIGSTLRELVGYVMLDLRSAQKSSNRAVWYRVLNSPYSKLKPELKIQLTLESDSDSLSRSSPSKPFVARPAPPRKLQPAQDILSSSSRLSGEESEIDTDKGSVNFEMVLNEEEGYFQLGHATEDNKVFHLSLTIRSATNLAQLIPTSVHLSMSASDDHLADRPRDQQGYYFFFSLVGNEIVNQPFWDLLNPDFAVERAAVRIRCNDDTIKKFLAKEPDMELHLACRGQSLGVARLPISQLTVQPRMSFSGFFPLFSTQGHREQIKGESQPCVAVTLKLEVEGDDMVKTVTDDEVAALAVDSQSVSQIAKITAPQEMVSGALEDDRQSSSHHPQVMVELPRHTVAHSKSPAHVGSFGTDLVLHRFCYSVELRSVKNLDVTPVGSVAFIYLRYTYPYFGSPSPVMTSPAVEVRRHMETRLPRGFCAFEFVTSSQQLRNSLQRDPLKVEVWHRDRHSSDVLLGITEIPLSTVYNQERVALSSGGHHCGWRQTTVGTFPIEKIEGLSQTVGEVKVTLALDDHGPITESMAESMACYSGYSSGPSRDIAEQEPAIPENASGAQYIGHQQRQVFSNSEMVELRGGLEYQAALELEIWKEETEQGFLAQLKEKEKKHMTTLADEWKRRDKEREVIFKKKVDEYTHLKEKLEKEVHELRKREQQLTLGEQQLHHQWSALEQHRDHSKKETKDAEKRLSETYEHQLELERLRIRELDDQKKHLQAQILEWEKRYDSKVAEFTSFKEQQNGRPEIQLQSDINMLTLEKVELERKVDSLTKSKLHYKQQWGRALRELSILKQKEQADARARLKKQQKELEHMRLRYLAHEEKEVMQSEKQELHDIKLELEKLKNERQPAQEDNKAVERKLHSEQSEGIDTDQQRALEETELDNKVARMIEERDTLMQTGVYSTNDRIITELDRQIRETLAMKGKRT